MKRPFIAREFRSGHEADADGCADLDLIPGRSETSGVPVDPEHDDIVRVLVRCRQELTTRAYFEVAGDPASRTLVANHPDFTLIVNGINHDAVMAAIGAV